MVADAAIALDTAIICIKGICKGKEAHDVLTGAPST
jgi:hypothetical protein